MVESGDGGARIDEPFTPKSLLSLRPGQGVSPPSSGPPAPAPLPTYCISHLLQVEVTICVQMNCLGGGLCSSSAFLVQYVFFLMELYFF